jgi:hypothetical protein
MTQDTTWAVEQLESFIKMTTPHNGSGNGVFTTQDYPAAKESDIVAEQDVIEAILDQFFPDWRTTVEARNTYKWHRHYTAAQRCLARIRRREEMEKKLGATAPKLSTAAMHRWVWEAAKPQWSSGHLAEAVSAATRSINSRLQQKLGRRDVSELRLVREAFTLNPPTPAAKRLRVMEDDGSDTYKSLHQGILSFGSGCFQAIRNPLAHLDPGGVEISEQEALERLAALSLLARWVDDAVVAEGDGGTA